VVNVAFQRFQIFDYGDHTVGELAFIAQIRSHRPARQLRYSVFQRVVARHHSINLLLGSTGLDLDEDNMLDHHYLRIWFAPGSKTGGTLPGSQLKSSLKRIALALRQDLHQSLFKVRRHGQVIGD
jgi:hypothetical protein